MRLRHTSAGTVVTVPAGHPYTASDSWEEIVDDEHNDGADRPAGIKLGTIGEPGDTGDTGEPGDDGDADGHTDGDSDAAGSGDEPATSTDGGGNAVREPVAKPRRKADPGTGRKPAAKGTDKS